MVFLLEEAWAVLWGAALSMDRLSARILSERLGEENHQPDRSIPAIQQAFIQRASQVAEGSHCPGELVTTESNLDVTVIKPV